MELYLGGVDMDYVGRIVLKTAERRLSCKIVVLAVGRAEA